MLTKKSSEEGNNIYETIDTNTTENVEVHPEADAISDKHTKGSVENKHNDFGCQQIYFHMEDISEPVSVHDVCKHTDTGWNTACLFSSYSLSTYCSFTLS